ncbi:hypothetical protein BLGI_650 [Brevibacillus laterosporus GI-9]|nr:hypothetical protein BLGI_650 [Brevibacillus laterosporus GI-9]
MWSHFFCYLENKRFTLFFSSYQLLLMRSYGLDLKEYG